MSCGARHSAVLTEDGRAFGCGCNKHAELGLAEDKVALLTELTVPALSSGSGRKVADVECGWWHTVFLVEMQS